jgi:hypothetical protein
MESSEKKTSPRPDLGRPSLLSSQASPASGKEASLRMLSALEREGKTPAQAATVQSRSRTRLGLVALLLVALGGGGAFYLYGSGDDVLGNGMAVAEAPHNAVLPARPASQAASAAAVALSGSDAAPAATASAATPAAIELAAAKPVPASASAPATAGSSEVAAHGGGNPLDKLVLNDAPTEPARPAQAARGKHARAGEPAAKAHGDTAAPAAAKVHDEAVASARKEAQHPAAPAAPTRKAKREDDADTELVAAIIARLDKRGPAAPPGAASAAAGPAPASVAEAVRRCSQTGDLIEARQCRSRACEGHWGKIDACPASRAPKTSQAESTDGKPG